jgi:D-glycero-alpha-D-manno-heptose 1-phosphate guanylyltransferase
VRLLVLAGGFGTRLKEAVVSVPKPLAPIGATPFLQLQLEHWVDQGLREFSFLLYHQAEQVTAFLRTQKSSLLRGCQINWLIEPVPLGTGGSIAHAVKTLNLKDDILVINADTWLGGGIHEVISSAVPSIAAVNLSDVSRYGQVHFGHDLRVFAFTEKSDQRSSGWINAGLCQLNPELFKNWDGQPFSLECDLFPILIQDGRLTAVPLETSFIDIGIPDDYHRFCRWIAGGRKEPLCS